MLDLAVVEELLECIGNGEQLPAGGYHPLEVKVREILYSTSRAVDEESLRRAIGGQGFLGLLLQLIGCIPSATRACPAQIRRLHAEIVLKVLSERIHGHIQPENFNQFVAALLWVHDDTDEENRQPAGRRRDTVRALVAEFLYTLSTSTPMCSKVQAWATQILQCQVEAYASKDDWCLEVLKEQSLHHAARNGKMFHRLHNEATQMEKLQLLSDSDVARHVLECFLSSEKIGELLSSSAVVKQKRLADSLGLETRYSAKQLKAQDVIQRVAHCDLSQLQHLVVDARINKPSCDGLLLASLWTQDEDPVVQAMVTCYASVFPLSFTSVAQHLLAHNLIPLPSIYEWHPRPILKCILSHNDKVSQSFGELCVRKVHQLIRHAQEAARQHGISGVLRPALVIQTVCITCWDEVRSSTVYCNLDELRPSELFLVGCEVLDLLLHAPSPFQSRLVTALAIIACLVHEGESSTALAEKLQLAAAGALRMASPSYLRSAISRKAALLSALLVSSLIPCTTAAAHTWLHKGYSITAMAQALVNMLASEQNGYTALSCDPCATVDKQVEMRANAAASGCLAATTLRMLLLDLAPELLLAQSKQLLACLEPLQDSPLKQACFLRLRMLSSMYRS